MICDCRRRLTGTIAPDRKDDFAVQAVRRASHGCDPVGAPGNVLLAFSVDGK
jgi:hypothetical protein